MGKYLIKGNYVGDGVAGLLKEGGSARLAAATAAVESVGGSVTPLMTPEDLDEVAKKSPTYVPPGS